jgi:glutamine amidotransferase
MCIAILQPIGKKIPKENLSTSWDTCDDGAGCMYVHNGKLYVHKEIYSFESFYAYYKHIEKIVNNTSPIVLHFRMKTHGAICLLNTHPHWVNDDLWFVHNGIISTLPAPIPANTSDSISLSTQILQQMPRGFHLNPVECLLLEKYIGTNKLIFLDSAGNTSIINEKLGIWDEDIWYSNTNYKKYAHAGLEVFNAYNYGTRTQSPPANANERFFNSANPWGEKDTTISAPAVPSTPSVIFKDTCLLCQTNPLVSVSDKQFATCSSCRAALSWGDTYGADSY